MSAHGLLHARKSTIVATDTVRHAGGGPGAGARDDRWLTLTQLVPTMRASEPAAITPQQVQRCRSALCEGALIERALLTVFVPVPCICRPGAGMLPDLQAPLSCYTCYIHIQQFELHARALQAAPLLLPPASLAQGTPAVSQRPVPTVPAVPMDAGGRDGGAAATAEQDGSWHGGQQAAALLVPAEGSSHGGVSFSQLMVGSWSLWWHLSAFVFTILNPCSSHVHRCSPSKSLVTATKTRTAPLVSDSFSDSWVQAHLETHLHLLL